MLLGAGAIWYHWGYTLGPRRKLCDPVWLVEHSERARWIEEQKDYLRTGRLPSCVYGHQIGAYGDKEWFLWLVDRIGSKGFQMYGCISVVLEGMSNRRSGSSGHTWKEWARANRSRTQEEWIRDGFKAWGLEVHLPPEESDTVCLLELLGRASPDEGRRYTPRTTTSAVPGHIEYNAFRWLRDGGFDVIKFKESVVDSSTSEAVKLGVASYQTFLAYYPPQQGVGILSFAEPWDARDYVNPTSELPALTLYGFPALFVGMLCLGTLLIALPSLIRRPHATSASSPTARAPRQPHGVPGTPLDP